METKTISQSVVITGASPHELYEIFMDEKKHADLIDSGARISRNIGGKFEIYDEYIDGTNIELVQDKKIVQYWRGEEDCWPEDHYSKLSITFEKDGDGTRAELVQEDVPNECADSFDKGWHEFYWNPMKALFKK
ncbi:MAG: SRPBCC domain-containing protein [Actinomycetota bacterium]